MYLQGIGIIVSSNFLLFVGKLYKILTINIKNRKEGNRERVQKFLVYFFLGDSGYTNFLP